jgi:hypothetical protein
MLGIKRRQQKGEETEQSSTVGPAEFGFVSYRPGEGWVFEGKSSVISNTT